MQLEGTELEFLAPVSGTVIPMVDVPDPVFSALMVGPGAAIDPFPGGLTVVAPCAGVVRKSKPHGFIIQMDDGTGVLIHLGLDTVELGGEGFTGLASPGQRVEPGQPIMIWNTGVAAKAGYSLCSPVVLIGTDPQAVTIIPETGKVEVGKPFLRVTR